MKDDNSVVAKFATTASDGKTYNVEYYNLDVIISVGYRVKSENGVIFGELKGKKFMLNKMAADQIIMINNIPETAKILLSAVAGAVIQHLIDNNCQINSIFENGYFIIKNGS